MHPILEYLLETHDPDWWSEMDSDLGLHIYHPILSEDFYLTESNSMYMSTLTEGLEDELEAFLESHCR